jgi:hypothetical protein
MARPQRYTPAQVATALKRTKGLQHLAAKELGCTYMTIRRYIARYAVVREAATTQRGELVDLAEMRLYQSILRGEAWGVTLCLKTLGKDRGYVERQEQTGPAGTPLPRGTIVVIKDPDGAAHAAQNGTARAPLTARLARETTPLAQLQYWWRQASAAERQAFHQTIHNEEAWTHPPGSSQGGPTMEGIADAQ